VLARAVERAGGIDLVVTAPSRRRVHGHGGGQWRAARWPSLTFATHVEVADGNVTIRRQTEAGFDTWSRRCPRS